MRSKEGQVIQMTTLLDSLAFDEFWRRVKPVGLAKGASVDQECAGASELR